MFTLRKLTQNLAAAPKDLKRVFKQNNLQNRSRCSTIMEKSPPAPAPEETQPQYYTIPSGILGQPTYLTHPHLLGEGQLTYGITQEEYRQRRETLVNNLVSESDHKHKSHIIIIPAARKQYMSDKIPFVFRQHSDFFYLTGCMEPSAILVMIKPSQTENYRSVLFVHDKDSHAEMWEGPRTGCVNSTLLYAVDEARPVEFFSNFLTKLASTSKPAVLWYNNDQPANPDIHATVRSVLRHDSQVTIGDPQRALHFMRVVKSKAEIELMKETCDIGSQAINVAMSCTRPGVTEHAINAVLEYSSKMSGAEHLAFPPVVGGGARATHIHYVYNNQVLNADEMLLVDSGKLTAVRDVPKGCQRWLYNSDISRTWPVSGKFSKYHRILYELVLSVQKRLIEIVGEHRPPLDQLFDSMCRLLGTKLQAEGILPRNIDHHQLIAEAYRLCPHHVSHYLGLDVHDAPLVRRAHPLMNNMIITVEPGLYIRPDDTKVPQEFRGVGIRIEDDVLITEGDPVVLTNNCFKEVSDIEAVVGTQNMT